MAENNQTPECVNKIETKRTLKRINKKQELFLEKINKIDKT